MVLARTPIAISMDVYSQLCCRPLGMKCDRTMESCSIAMADRCRQRSSLQARTSSRSREQIALSVLMSGTQWTLRLVIITYVHAAPRAVEVPRRSDVRATTNGLDLFVVGQKN